jgi:hypothetical protein
VVDGKSAGHLVVGVYWLRQLAQRWNAGRRGDYENARNALKHTINPRANFRGG